MSELALLTVTSQVLSREGRAPPTATHTPTSVSWHEMMKTRFGLLSYVGGVAFLTHQPVAAFSPAPVPAWPQRFNAIALPRRILCSSTQGGIKSTSFTERPEKPPPRPLRE